MPALRLARATIDGWTTCLSRFFFCLGESRGSLAQNRGKVLAFVFFAVLRVDKHGAWVSSYGCKGSVFLNFPGSFFEV